MKKLYLILLLVLPTIGHSDGFYYYGKDLLSECENSEPSHQLTCLAYVQGVYDSYDALIDSDLLKPLFCVPDDAKAEQLKKTFVAYMNKNPKELDYGAGSLTLFSLMEAFPCE